MRALCVLKGDVNGQVFLYQETPGSLLKMQGFIYNLPKGKHGFHVHEFGDTSNGCASAGEHYNPFSEQHGGPNSEVRHLGDLGNIYSSSASTTTTFEKMDTRLSLFGPYSILGRSMVVHAMEDDYGLGENLLSKTTGNSGGRLACGIIGLAK